MYSAPHLNSPIGPSVEAGHEGLEHRQSSAFVDMCAGTAQQHETTHGAKFIQRLWPSPWLELCAGCGEGEAIQLLPRREARCKSTFARERRTVERKSSGAISNQPKNYLALVEINSRRTTSHMHLHIIVAQAMPSK